MVRKPVTELTLEDWNRVIGTNLTGAFLTAKHCAHLLRANRGSIVNIASTRAHMSEPDTEAYAASKGGIVALTHALALSLGPEVRVNVVSPGWINVDPDAVLNEADHAQHPAGRVGTPRDVADAVTWLLSAGFATGTEVVLDGGMTRKMIYVE
ncbi:NAD(P)-dependent dehydrogenase (short-subunit alcohol dehydrogenase family) [Azospirillum soli]|nr:NAD(P)-dependent dehydrogenase (short-subunit alcohol dehydrogenase family) [Azospirillum soli]